MTKLKLDFIGIGTTRSGSSWIYNCLKEHPEICLSSKKEPKFFNRTYKYRKGLDYYRKYFNHCPKKKIRGEFSPDYILCPKTPYLIYRHFPDAKIIACLRNPVEKIFSVYKYHVAAGYQYSIYKTFEEAVKKNPSIVERGLYYKQLKKYFELFQSENILVLFYEDLKQEPIGFLKKIYNFLGLTNKEFIPLIINEKVNVGGTRTTKNRIPLINTLLYWIISKFTNNYKFKNVNNKYRLNEIIGRVRAFNIIRGVEYYNERIFNMVLNEQVRHFLLKKFVPDIKCLEGLLERKLDFWYN